MTRLFEGRPWVRSVAIAVALSFLGLGVMSCGGDTQTEPDDAGGGLVIDADGKTPICHYQQDIGTWTLTRLSLEAALEHLAKHDDAVPGGLTAITKTRLDSQCKRVS